MTQPVCAYEGCGEPEDNDRHVFYESIGSCSWNHRFEPATDSEKGHVSAAPIETAASHLPNDSTQPQPESTVESASVSPQGGGEHKKCLGYPDCDGMLPGEEHEAACPLAGTYGPPPSMTTPPRIQGAAINSQSSMQYVGMKLHSGDATLQQVLEWMVDGGSSVSLNFGEDTGLWECSWITHGERFTGVQKLVRMAVLESLNMAFARAVQLGPPKEKK